MSLKIQIYTLFFSFLFGMFFSWLLNVNYKLIYNEKKIVKFIFSFIFVVINAFIYFIGINKINNGILHPYSLICIILGFSIVDMIKKR